MHVPTWNVVESPIELVLSVATIGAQYCFEHSNAERLFHAAKAILFERLTQNASRFGPKTAAVLSMQGRSPKSTPEDPKGPNIGCDKWEPIDTVRALINVMGYATWDMKQSLVQEAFALQGLLIQVLRDLGLEEEEEHHSADSDQGSVHSRWLDWVHRESVRRAKLIAFSFTHTHSIAYDVYPPLRTNEIHLRLPCHTRVWKASTSTAWLTAQSEIKKQQMSFQEALSLLLRDSNCALDPVPTPLGNYLLLHGLLQRIYIVRDLSLPIMDRTASLPPDEVDKLECVSNCRVLNLVVFLTDPPPLVEVSDLGQRVGNKPPSLALTRITKTGPYLSHRVHCLASPMSAFISTSGPIDALKLETRSRLPRP